MRTPGGHSQKGHTQSGTKRLNMEDAPRSEDTRRSQPAGAHTEFNEEVGHGEHSQKEPHGDHIKSGEHGEHIKLET